MPSLVAVRPVIELAFDPVTQIGDWNVRLQTIALAVVILVALLAAARIARRTPVDLTRSADDHVVLALDHATAPGTGTDPGAGTASAVLEQPEPNHLRRDDLLYIVVASLPGAVVGGRLGYWLLHLDYYTVNPGAILDIGQGGFQLSLAVVGGVLGASVVASLLGAPVGRWLHAAILPLLLAIAGGKLAMALGGEGQGVPWDGPWATAYTGSGPWLSLAPEISSHPAQVYEAFATFAVLAVLVLLLAGGAFARKAGGAFLVGIVLWVLARLVVAVTWRDPAVLGPLRMDQVISLAIAGVSLALLAAGAVRSRRPAPRPDGTQVIAALDPRESGAPVMPGVSLAPRPARRATSGPDPVDPEWPDPGSRPNI